MAIDTGVASLVAGYVVTPSDSTVFKDNCRALWVGAAGNVVVRMAADGGLLTFTGVPAGTLLPIQCTQVMAATTATSILALR